MEDIDKNIDTEARKLVLSLDHLMAQVDYEYNRHQSCLVCNEKYKHHEDGLPCLSDNKTKRIVKYNYGRDRKV